MRSISSSQRPTPALRGDHERRVLHEAALIHEVGDVLPGGALAGRAPPRDRIGPPMVEPDVVPVERPPRDPAARGRDRSPPRPRLPRRVAPSPSSTNTSGSPGITVSPTAIGMPVTTPANSAATMCSIFIDSSTTSCWPTRTTSPSATSIDTTVPCIGDATGCIRLV